MCGLKRSLLVNLKYSVTNVTMTLRSHNIIFGIIFVQILVTSLSSAAFSGAYSNKTTSSIEELLIASVTKPDYCEIMISGKLSAFVIGATGEVGKAIVKELAKNNLFDRVTLIARRQVDLPESGEDGSNYSKFDQKIVNFDKLSTDHASDLVGYDVGFCALGTTRAISGHDGFIRVDHDYVMDTARLAKSGGCKHFNLVSSAGANKNSYFLYQRVKGEVEEEVTQLAFDRLSIWRPGLLICERSERRVVEYVLQILAKLDSHRRYSIEVPVLARVIVSNVLKPAKSPFEIIYNGEIR